MDSSRRTAVAAVSIALLQLAGCGGGDGIEQPVRVAFHMFDTLRSNAPGTTEVRVARDMAQWLALLAVYAPSRANSYPPEWFDIDFSSEMGVAVFMAHSCQENVVGVEADSQQMTIHLQRAPMGVACNLLESSSFLLKTDAYPGPVATTFD